LKYAPEYLLIGDLGGCVLPKRKAIATKERREEIEGQAFIFLILTIIAIVFVYAMVYSRGEPWNYVAFTSLIVVIVIELFLIARFFKRRKRLIV
jgi:membrane protein YdbS with pleckstrin-like domain